MSTGCTLGHRPWEAVTRNDAGNRIEPSSFSTSLQLTSPDLSLLIFVSAVPSPCRHCRDSSYLFRLASSPPAIPDSRRTQNLCPGAVSLFLFLLPYSCPASWWPVRANLLFCLGTGSPLCRIVAV